MSGKYINWFWLSRDSNDLLEPAVIIAWSHKPIKLGTVFVRNEKYWKDDAICHMSFSNGKRIAKKMKDKYGVQLKPGQLFCLRTKRFVSQK